MKIALPQFMRQITVFSHSQKNHASPQTRSWCLLFVLHLCAVQIKGDEKEETQGRKALQFLDIKHTVEARITRTEGHC